MSEIHPPLQQWHRTTDTDAINIIAFPATLWRGKWVIFLITATFCALGGYYAFIATTPVFRARTDIILETRLNQIVDLESVVGRLSSDSAIVNSEVEVLRARDLMEQVVKHLDLTQDPEFNEILRTPGMMTRLQRAIGISDAFPPSPQRTLNKTVDVLVTKTHVRNIPFSLVFTVIVETQDPEKSALITDTIAEIYIRNQIEGKLEATRQATSWLSGQVSELQFALEGTERQISAFSSDTDLISQESLRALERQLKDQRQRVAEAQSDAEAKTFLLQKLRGAVDPAELAAIANDRELEGLFHDWVSAGTDEAELAFKQASVRFTQRTELTALRAQEQLETLGGAMNSLEQRIARQSQDLIRLQHLSREAEASRLLYEHFLTRLKETSSQQGIQQADSRVLSKAVIPSAPAAPNRGLILSLSLFMGLSAGAALVALRQMISPRIRSARDLEDATGYAVLGEIPKISNGKPEAVLHYLNEKPMSAAAEAVRSLRTSLMLSRPDTPPQIILSTSASPGEGKTTTAVALAQNFGQMGKKVLLIEGDTRRRVLNEYLKIPPKAGITDVLSGAHSLKDAVSHVVKSGIDVLTGDKAKVSAADLFGSAKFRDLLDEARAHWDIILIDCPPVLAVPDARVLAQYADAILFTVHWDKTTSTQIKSGLRLFEMVNLRPAGFVLNQIGPAGLRGYAYSGRREQQQGYYEN